MIKSSWLAEWKQVECSQQQQVEEVEESFYAKQIRRSSGEKAAPMQFLTFMTTLFAPSFCLVG
jgi:hypothetical protein